MAPNTPLQEMVVPTYTRARDRVALIAAAQPQEALRIARAIEEPWFRCQALAFAAHHIQDLHTKNGILRESFKAALQTPGPNRVVTVSAWPLKVLCKSGQHKQVESEANRLLDTLSQEPSPVRRADALNELLGAVITSPRPIFWKVFASFEEACLTPLLSGQWNSKGESSLARWLVVIHQLDESRADAIVNKLKGPTLRKRVESAVRECGNLDLEELVPWPAL